MKTTIDKIKNVAELLGFKHVSNNTKWVANLLVNRKIVYEIYINSANKLTTIDFNKHTNTNSTYICSYTTDLDLVYKCIVDEFEHELRKNKIDNLINTNEI